jgi:hypothetical protein
MTETAWRAGSLLAVAGIAGLASGSYASYRAGLLLREQLVRRGQYMATNLAVNSTYGVLTEDAPLLNQLIDGAITASSRGAESDLAAVVIRDVKGAILARGGASLKDTARSHAREQEPLDAVTEKGEPVLLFRAPVRAVPAECIERELRARANDKDCVVTQRGWVELALSTRGLTEQRRAALWQTHGVAVALAALGSLVALVFQAADAKAANKVL